MSKKRGNQDRSRKKRRERLQRQKAKKAAAQSQGLAGLLPPNVQFVGAIPGMPKMSEQLLAFVEPYASVADTEEAYHKLLMVAIVAWNVALEPAEKRSTALTPFLKSLGGEGSPGARDFLEIVGALIKRKDADPRFAQDSRVIVNFTVTETPTGPSLQVLSAVPPEKLASGSRER